MDEDDGEGFLRRVSVSTPWRRNRKTTLAQRIADDDDDGFEAFLPVTSNVSTPHQLKHSLHRISTSIDRKLSVTIDDDDDSCMPEWTRKNERLNDHEDQSGFIPQEEVNDDDIDDEYGLSRDVQHSPKSLCSDKCIIVRPIPQQHTPWTKMMKGSIRSGSKSGENSDAGTMKSPPPSLPPLPFDSANKKRRKVSHVRGGYTERLKQLRQNTKGDLAMWKHGGSVDEKSSPALLLLVVNVKTVKCGVVISRCVIKSYDATYAASHNHEADQSILGPLSSPIRSSGTAATMSTTSKMLLNDDSSGIPTHVDVLFSEEQWRKELRLELGSLFEVHRPWLELDMTKSIYNGKNETSMNRYNSTIVMLCVNKCVLPSIEGVYSDSFRSETPCASLDRRAFTITPVKAASNITANSTGGVFSTSHLLRSSAAVETLSLQRDIHADIMDACNRRHFTASRQSLVKRGGRLFRDFADADKIDGDTKANAVSVRTVASIDDSAFVPVSEIPTFSLDVISLCARLQLIITMPCKSLCNMSPSERCDCPSQGWLVVLQDEYGVVLVRIHRTPNNGLEGPCICGFRSLVKPTGWSALVYSRNVGKVFAIHGLHVAGIADASKYSALFSIINWGTACHRPGRDCRAAPLRCIVLTPSADVWIKPTILQDGMIVKRVRCSMRISEEIPGVIDSCSDQCVFRKRHHVISSPISLIDNFPPVWTEPVSTDNNMEMPTSSRRAMLGSVLKFDDSISQKDYQAIFYLVSAEGTQRINIAHNFWISSRILRAGSELELHWVRVDADGSFIVDTCTTISPLEKTE